MSSDVVVTGHMCLDVIPGFEKPSVDLRPGALIEVGEATFAPGGAVSNVGLALKKLGAKPRLVGHVGDDPFGEILRSKLREIASPGACDITTMERATTSYTVVVSPPGKDRTFLHHAGCNDHVKPSAIDAEMTADARLFYFGYPPAMRRTYVDGGDALGTLFASVKRKGASTALDVSMPDPSSEAGRTDWMPFMARVLPHVDIFMPSLEETRYMLDGDRSPETTPPSAEIVSRLGKRLLEMGAGIVGLKLGDHGLYVCTADDARLRKAGRALPNTDGWSTRELWAPIFDVDVQGTTGSGDATVAGFLAALLRGTSIEDAVNIAVAVGACSVEAQDATSGVKSWQTTKSRIESNWRRADWTLPDRGWVRHASGVLMGPNDARIRPRDTATNSTE